jgi:predicted ABC-type ATPase
MELYIIAGPNGVGKTTFAREFLPKYADCKNFVNADLIAQAMAPFSPETAAIRAGKMMLSEIRSFAKNRVSLWANEVSLFPAANCRGETTQKLPSECGSIGRGRGLRNGL